MKKLRGIIKKCVAGFITFAFIAIAMLPMEAKAAGPVYYTALGDSITAGVFPGQQTYIYSVANHLKKKHGNVVTTNLGRGGMTSYELFDALTNPKNVDYHYFRNSIKKSNYITLDIGSNDYFKGIEQVYAYAFGCSKDEVWSKLDSLCERMRNGNYQEAYKAYLEAKVAAEKIHNELYYGKSMDNVFAKYQITYKKILSEISKLAPNAKVYIGTLYNPYIGAPSMMIADYEIINIEKYTDKYIKLMNQFISSNSGKCKVVDLYTCISKGDRYFYADYSYLNYDPHPNDEGHELIANQFIQTIK